MGRGGLASGEGGVGIGGGAGARRGHRLGRTCQSQKLPAFHLVRAPAGQGTAEASPVDQELSSCSGPATLPPPRPRAALRSSQPPCSAQTGPWGPTSREVPWGLAPTRGPLGCRLPVLPDAWGVQTQPPALLRTGGLQHGSSVLPGLGVLDTPSSRVQIPKARSHPLQATGAPCVLADS